MYKIKLKNSDDSAIIDKVVYDYIMKEKFLCDVKFLKNIRKHSTGCCVFQCNMKEANGSFRIKTIYLHKLIAENFLKKPAKDRKLVGFKNGNRLDCRTDNLVYRTRSEASRVKKTTSRSGYTGVYAEGERYRAVISIDGQVMHLGMYDTPEEAALAYNEVSVDHYGERGKINKIKPKRRLARK